MKNTIMRFLMLELVLGIFDGQAHAAKKLKLELQIHSNGTIYSHGVLDGPEDRQLCAIIPATEKISDEIFALGVGTFSCNATATRSFTFNVGTNTGHVVYTVYGITDCKKE